MICVAGAVQRPAAAIAAACPFVVGRDDNVNGEGAFQELRSCRGCKGRTAGRTTRGIAQSGVDLSGLNATVVGASNHIGRPVGFELLLAGCNVTTVHRFSRATGNRVPQADVVVSATGKAGLIAADSVKPGPILIDVGIVAQAHGNVRGDIRFDEVAPHAGWITSVPGGVGPMTRADLLDNTYGAAESAHRLRAPLT